VRRAAVIALLNDSEAIMSRTKRAFAPALSVLGLVTFLSGAQAQGVPTLDVSRTCQRVPGDLEAGVKFDADRCLKSESNAREQLAREWAEFKPADRTLCAQTAAMGGIASYVQLLTCLELKREVARLPANRM
jgi:hypothetical protein